MGWWQAEIGPVATMGRQEGIAFFAFHDGGETDNGDGRLAIGGGPGATEMDAVSIVTALIIFYMYGGSCRGGQAFEKGHHGGGYAMVVAREGVEGEGIGA